MQNAGVVGTLHKYCKKFPLRKQSPRELINTIVSWEKVYGSHIKQIELRALDQAGGNYSGRQDLLHTSVAEMPSIPESDWNNRSNMWHSNDEEESWKPTSRFTATSTESTPKRLTKDAYIESGTNKSFFISIRPSVNKLNSIFPIVLISPVDLLGMFSGKIRFTEDCNVAQSIMGPTPYL